MSAKQKVTIAVAVVMMLTMLMTLWGGMKANAATFIVNKNSCTLYAGGSGSGNTVTVNCSSTWTLKEKDNWIKLSKSSGGIGQTSFTITADKNYGFARTGKVVITSLGDTRTISVTQYGNGVTISDDQVVLNAGSGSSTITASVTVGGLTCSTPSASWVKASYSGGKVTITVTENTTGEERKASFKVMCSNNNNVYKTVNVKQKPHFVTLDSSSHEFSAAAGTKTVYVTTGAGSFEVDNRIPWLSVEESSGYITLSAQANTSTNPRSGTFTVTSGGKKAEFAVSQKGNTLTLSGSEYKPAAAGGKSYITVNVGSKSDYTATSTVDWIKCTKNGTEVCIEVKPNPDSEGRQEKVTITSCGIFKYYNVIQDGCKLEAKVSGAEYDESTKTISLPTASKAFTIIPDTNYGSWEVKSESTWLKVTKEGSSAKVVADTNYFLYTRYGTLKVIAGNQVITYVVKQEGDSLTLGLESYTEEASGGTLEIKVTVASGAEFSVDCPEDWVALTKHTKSVSVKVAPNPNAEGRVATVTVSSGVMKKTIKVVQHESKITLSENELLFEGPAGEKSITAESTSGLPIEVVDTWVWINTEVQGNTVKISVEPNNSGRERSASITVNSGMVSETVKITQQPHTLELGIDPVINSDAGSKTHNVSVSTNSESWTVTSSNPKWLNVVQTDKYTFVISITMNKDGISRSGTITVDAGGTTKTIKVNQSANIIEINPARFVTDGKGKILKAKIDTLYGTWNVKTVSADWLYATKDTESQLVISVTEKKPDPKNKVRLGYVIVESNGKVEDIPVYQCDEMPAFVTLETNGHGKISEDYARWVFEGEKYPENCVPEMSEEGYVFLGWYLDEEFTEKVDKNTTCKKTENHTLYAKWEEAKLRVFSTNYAEVSEIYTNAGGYAFFVNDAILVTDNDLIVATNDPDTLTVSANDLGWLNVTRIGPEEVYAFDYSAEEGFSYFRYTVKVDPFYSNLGPTPDPMKQKVLEGRNGIISVSAAGQTVEVKLYQHPFYYIDADEEFYSAKYNCISAIESEKKTPQTLVGDWLYCANESSGNTIYGYTESHKLSSACMLADDRREAAFESMSLSYTFSNSYMKDTPIAFTVDEITTYADGDYDRARAYMKITDIKVDVKVKDPSIRIADAYSLYTDEETNERINSQRDLLYNITGIADEVISNVVSIWFPAVAEKLPKLENIASLICSADMVSEGLSEWIELEFGDEPVDEKELAIVREEALFNVASYVMEALNAFNIEIDIYGETIGEIDEEMREEIIEEIFADEKMQDTIEDISEEIIDFIKDVMDEHGYSVKGKIADALEDAVDHTVYRFIYELVFGDLTEGMREREKVHEARQQGEQHQGSGVTYGGSITHSDSWSYSVPEIGTAISYFDICLELCDSEGNVVEYDADDIEISCTGVIGGRRIDLLNPEEVNG